MCSFSIGQGKSLYPRDQFCPSVICAMCILYFYNQRLWFMCGAVLWMTHAELFQALRNYLCEVYLYSVIFTRTCRPVKSLLNHEYFLKIQTAIYLPALLSLVFCRKPVLCQVLRITHLLSIILLTFSYSQTWYGQRNHNMAGSCYLWVNILELHLDKMKNFVYGMNVQEYLCYLKSERGKGLAARHLLISCP